VDGRGATGAEVSARQFRAFDGAALVVATVIGSGIFTVPGIVARLVPHGGAVLVMWMAGGALALAGALAYAELATRFPRSGGEYVYLREAFGPLVGFLSGWTSFVAGFSGAIAASAVGIAAYLGRLVPGLAAEPFAQVAIGPLSVTLSPATAVSIGVIVTFTVINLIGVSAGRLATSVLAVTLVGGTALFAAFGLSADAIAPSGGARATLAGAGAALVPIMFTYSGWNAATYISDHFRHPTRDVPRALAAGTALVTLLYVTLNWALLRVLSVPTLAATATPVEAAARAIFGAAGSAWLTVLVLAALGSSVSAMIVTGPRIYAAMAADGALPRVFAAARGDDRRPTVAIVSQSVWSCVLVLTGTFEALVTYTGFAIVLFSGAAVLGLFVIRRRAAGPSDAYRTWGYPVLPAVFVASSVFMLIATIRFQPAASLAGAAVIAAGIPVHLYMMARSAVRLPTASADIPRAIP
jgi:APA family basic amino acid/polyamine antiporter